MKTTNTPVATRTLFDQDAYQATTSAIVQDVRDTESGSAIVLNQTVFYPAGGGQPGDTGWLKLGDGTAYSVVGTAWDRENPGVILHFLDTHLNKETIGQAITGELHWQQRYRHMQMHTCLHILSSLVDAPVTGCSIAAEKGRLDFDLPEPTIDKVSLTDGLNQCIADDQPVGVFKLTPQELAESEYAAKTANVKPPVIGGHIRMVGIQDVDVQPCGGTHVRRTGEINRVVCVKIEKRSKKNRRVVLQWEEGGC